MSERSETSLGPLASRIQSLLMAAAAAHHDAYIETDGLHAEWAEWYADFLQEKLAEVTGRPVDEAELAAWLTAADARYRFEAPEEAWPVYYARAYVTGFGPAGPEVKMSDEGDLNYDVKGVLVRAARAHHEAYLDVDGANPGWPAWYANHMQGDLKALLGREIALDELATWLVKMDEEYRDLAPDRSWVSYYAEKLLEKWGEGTNS